VALVAVAEVVDDVLGPLVRLGEQDAVGVVRVDLGADALEERVRRGKVLAVRPLLLEEVRDRIEPEPVEPEIEPEARPSSIASPTSGVLVVEVGLVVVEAVPEVRAALGVVRPVRLLESTKMIRASS
jgi:hypothetical protein